MSSPFFPGSESRTEPDGSSPCSLGLGLGFRAIRGQRSHPPHCVCKRQKVETMATNIDGVRHAVGIPPPEWDPTQPFPALRAGDRRAIDHARQTGVYDIGSNDILQVVDARRLVPTPLVEFEPGTNVPVVRPSDLPDVRRATYLVPDDDGTAPAGSVLGFFSQDWAWVAPPLRNGKRNLGACGLTCCQSSETRSVKFPEKKPDRRVANFHKHQGLVGRSPVWACHNHHIPCGCVHDLVAGMLQGATRCDGR